MTKCESTPHNSMYNKLGGFFFVFVFFLLNFEVCFFRLFCISFDYEPQIEMA